MAGHEPWFPDQLTPSRDHLGSHLRLQIRAEGSSTAVLCCAVLPKEQLMGRYYNCLFPLDSKGKSFASLLQQVLTPGHPT